MPLPVDPLEKARIREETRRRAREQAEQREKDSRARIRKLEEEYAHRRAVVLGKLVRDNWDKLATETRQEISQLLATSGLSPADKIKLATYLPGEPVPEDLGDFIRSDFDGSTDENLDRVAAE